MLLHYMYNVRDLKRKHFTSMRQAPLHVYERGDTPTNPNVAMNEPAVPTAIIVVQVVHLMRVIAKRVVRQLLQASIAFAS